MYGTTTSCLTSVAVRINQMYNIYSHRIYPYENCYLTYTVNAQRLQLFSYSTIAAGFPIRKVNYIHIYEKSAGIYKFVTSIS